MRLSGIGVVLLLGTASCATTATKQVDATGVFSRSETCPIGEVSITEEPVPSLREAILSESHPPSDIAEDPERLDMWIENHQSRGRTEGTKLRAYSAAGCGTSAEITCVDGWFGLNRCSVHQRHDAALDAKTNAVMKEADESLARAKREICGLPMSASNTLCKD